MKLKMILFFIFFSNFFSPYFRSSAIWLLGDNLTILFLDYQFYILIEYLKKKIEI